MRSAVRNSIKKMVLVASVAPLLGGLAACGGGDGSSGGSSGTGVDKSAATAAQKRLDAALKPQTSINLKTPLDAPPEKSKLTYAIRFNVEAANAVDEWTNIAAKVGWEGRVLAVDPADPVSSSNAMKQAVAAGADYITVGAASLDSVQGGLKVAKDAGVPVFFVTGFGEPEGKKNGLYGLAPDLRGYTNSLNALTDWAIADSSGTGSLLWVNYPDSPLVKAQEPLTRKYFSENCPKCTYRKVDVSTNDLASGKSTDVIVAEIRKNPDIKYVSFAVPQFVVGLRQALNAAGLNDVKIGIGGASSKADIAAVRNGDADIVSTVGVPEALYAVFDQILRLDQGQDVEQDAHGARPFQLFTAKTLGKTTSWGGPPDFAAQYLKLWRVG